MSDNTGTSADVNHDKAYVFLARHLHDLHTADKKAVKINRAKFAMTAPKTDVVVAFSKHLKVWSDIFHMSSRLEEAIAQQSVELFGQSATKQALATLGYPRVANVIST